MAGLGQGGEIAATLDAAPDAMLLLDGEGLVVSVNPAVERILGFPAAEIVGRRVGDVLVPARFRDAYRECLARLRDGGSSEVLDRRFEVVALRADEAEIEVELTVTRTADERFAAWIREVDEPGQPQAELARRTALLERAEQLALMGSWEWNLETDEILWSDNRFRLSGLEPGEVTPTLELIDMQTHPDDREQLARGIAIARNTGTMPALDYRAVLPDGQIRHLRARSTLVEQANGRPRLMIGTVEDLTDRRLAEREIAAHCAVSEVLDQWESFERSGERLLRNLAEALGYEVAGLWLPVDGVFVNRIQWSNAPEEVMSFAETSRRLRFPRGIGLIGRAWETGSPIAVDNFLAQDGDVLRRDAASRAGLRGAMALPARMAEDVLAVLDFYSREEVVVGPRLMRSLTGIGHELGRFFARRRGELIPTRLSARELEVLQLAAQGHSRSGIAERLVLSPATVKTHFENIYVKLGVSDKAAAVATGLRQGVIE